MQVRANGISLEVERFGPETAEPLLLIMGLGMQLLAWHEGLVQQLVGRGFQVIRFDNRDAGLSASLDHLGLPHIGLESMKYLMHLPAQSPYSLQDMAADGVGILNALGLGAAHVCGASMGGMIAQRMAIHFPQRVKSLTLMMTSSGSRALPLPSLKLSALLLNRPNPRRLDHVVEHYMQLLQMIGSPAYPADPVELRRTVEATVKRAYHPQGTQRQLMAVAADGDRSPALRRLDLPCHVIHGEADPLVQAVAGRDLAAKIRGASLDVIPGMGHDLPPALWPRFVQGIQAAADRG